MLNKLKRSFNKLGCLLYNFLHFKVFSVRRDEVLSRVVHIVVHIRCHDEQSADQFQVVCNSYGYWYAALFKEPRPYNVSVLSDPEETKKYTRIENPFIGCCIGLWQQLKTLTPKGKIYV